MINQVTTSTVDPTFLLNDYSQVCSVCNQELSTKAGNEEEGNEKLQKQLTKHTEEKHA